MTSEEKIARTFRLDGDVIEMIKELQKRYSDVYGLKVSQADVISLIVRNEYEQIEG